MVASNKTVSEVYSVIQRHTSVNQRTRILGDLAKVKGNNSFRQTVSALCNLHGQFLTEMRVSELADTEHITMEDDAQDDNDILPPIGGSYCMKGKHSE